MAYQVNKTDGTIVATVADGQIDQRSTGLTLIGKNYSGFGESINENFIKLLENFANTTLPANPIRGQLWFDVNELKLKVYSGTEFMPVSSATIANTLPQELGAGDLWFNNIDKQLYFYDGNNTILLGPDYSASQGLSGLKVNSILDTLNLTRVVTYLYTNGILLGIFSKDAFTPKNAITGFSGDITPGFNAGSLADLKFKVTVSNAEQLGGVNAVTYVRKDTDNSINGLLRITKDAGITIGSADQFSLRVDPSNQDIAFSVNRNNFQESAISINAESRTVDLYSTISGSRVNVGGDLVITGNLTVNGSTTTVNTTSLAITDKTIELANPGDSTAPTDVTANGGGIVLKGATDHSIVWKNNEVALPELGTAWNINDHINLVGSKYFAINGVEVLSATSLGSTITSIPGVSSFGKQTIIRVGPGSATDIASTAIQIENNKISTVQTNQNLEIEPNGTGNVALLGNPRITGVANPIDAQDAATKNYVDTVTQEQNLVFSMDLSDNASDSYIATEILNRLAPPPSVIPSSVYRNGSNARILCTISSNSSAALNINPLINLSTITVNTPSGTANAVSAVAIAETTIPPATVNITRIIKIFRIQSGYWTWISNTSLPST